MWLRSICISILALAIAMAIPITVGAQTVLMGGTNSNGTAPTKGPLVMSGWDGTNVRIFKTDSTGIQQIAITGAGYAGTGSCSANQYETADGTSGPTCAALPVLQCTSASSGADVIAKLNACMASLVSGIVDARSFTGTQTASSLGLTVPTNITLLLGPVTLITGDFSRMANNSAIVGSGMFQTTIQAKSFGVSTDIVITNSDAVNGNSGIIVRDLKVDANKTNGTHSTGVLSGINFTKCTDCYIFGVWGTNALSTSGGVDLRFNSGTRNHILHSFADLSDNIGIGMASETDYEVGYSTAKSNKGDGFDCGIGASSGTWSNLYSITNGTTNGAGIGIDTCGDITITNFKSHNDGEGSTRAQAINITNAQKNISIVGGELVGSSLGGDCIQLSANVNYVAISGMEIRNCGQNGILLNQSNHENIFGNHIMDVGQRTTNTYDGIALFTNGGGQNTIRNIINGNIVRNEVGTTMRYGISEVNTSGGTVGSNIISDNIFIAQTAGMLLLASVNDTVDGNKTSDSDGTVYVAAPGIAPIAAGSGTVGTNPLPFSSAFIGNAATNNIQLTGTATSAKVATFPDNTGTVAELNLAQTFTADQVFNTTNTGLKVPVVAGAAPTVSGNVAYDSTSNTYEGGVNGTNATFNINQVTKGGVLNLMVTAANFITAANTNLQTITGLSFTFPASQALNANIDCDLTYSQQTAAVADAFGFQDATIAPTNLEASGFVQTAATTWVDSTLTASSTTTATNIVAMTPSAITTIWHAKLHIGIEQPSNASTSLFSVMAKTGTAADTLTVFRGSGCLVHFQ